jgi:hypothetical protein
VIRTPSTYDDPINLVVPSLLRSGDTLPGRLADFQLRFARRAKGTLTLEADSKVVWQRQASWMPETRLTSTPIVLSLNTGFRSATP